MKPEIEQLKKIIDESSNIVFFGGAGVSTESGIPDFRSANGLYNQDLGRTVSPEEMISHSFYVRHTKDFYEFYKDKLIYKDAKPNACHKALAELEKQGKVRAIVTQNIDGLHQLAGSKTVFELHGSVLRNYCENCQCQSTTRRLMASICAELALIPVRESAWAMARSRIASCADCSGLTAMTKLGSCSRSFDLSVMPAAEVPCDSAVFRVLPRASIMVLSAC